MVTEKSSLVLKSDLSKRYAAEEVARAAYRELATSEDFKKLSKALAFLGFKAPALQALIDKEEKLSDKAKWKPPGIETGINGLTM